MPNKTFNARVQMKRDTSANWTSNNPVLLNGEIIIVDTDAGEVRFKVGNGTSTYTQLPYTDEAIISKMLSLSGGTMTGNINMDGNVVTGLGAPVNPTDAVRQQDLEVLSDEIDGIIAGTSPITLPIASDVRLGGVKVGEGVEITEDGTISVDAINQSEADARYLQLTGGSVTGPISFGSAGVGRYTLEDGELAIRSSEVGVYSTSGDLANPMFSVSPSIARLNTNLEMGAGVSIKNDTVPVDSVDLTNKAYVDNAIAAQVGSVYKPAGSIEFVNLPSPVTAEMLGRVYNVVDEFTADDRFLSGDVGETYPAGSNVAVVEETGSYFYDVLSGNVDLSDYVTNTQFTQGLAGKIDNPVGGSDGQVLVKTTSGATWQTMDVGVTSFNSRTGAVTPQEGDYTADMVGARPDTWTPSAADVGAVPTSRTVNGKALSSNITLTAEDVGAGPESTAQTITLSSSSWSASGSIYQQVANVTGVTADTPVIIVEPSLSTTDADANATILEAWGKIAKLEKTQGAGTITFRATENPGVNVPVKVGVC